MLSHEHPDLMLMDASRLQFWRRHHDGGLQARGGGQAHDGEEALGAPEQQRPASTRAAS